MSKWSYDSDEDVNYSPDDYDDERYGGRQVIYLDKDSNANGTTWLSGLLSLSGGGIDARRANSATVLGQTVNANSASCS